MYTPIFVRLWGVEVEWLCSVWKVAGSNPPLAAT